MPRFIPRQRKHKVRRRDEEQSRSAKGTPHDSNQVQIVPEGKSEREERKRKLRESLSAGETKISKQKQKRLDKYIETKLRKEETLDLLQKLSEQKSHTPGLVSSKSLGKRSFGAFVEGYGANNPTEEDMDNDSDASSDESEDEALDVDRASLAPMEFISYHEHSDVATNAIALGSGFGLKQPLHLDDTGLPVIESRNRRRKGKLKWAQDSEEPWEGFDEDVRDASEEIITTNAIHDRDDIEQAAVEKSKSPNADDDSQSSNGSTSDGSTASPGKNKSQGGISGFRAWATEQINRSLGYTPSNALDEPTQPPSEPTASTRKIPEREQTDLEVANHSSWRRAFVVQVRRSEAVEEARLKLPIVAEEQKIMEAVHNHPVVIVWGSTGSGKTTQVPQFLFEAGYGHPSSPTPGMIAVTQPRRVAAVSMAQRVEEELGAHGGKVAYQIRFESTTSSQTAIKFVTDGIIMRELAQDLLLRKYSAIIVDEAHERSINTDILIGMLSRVVPKREELSKSDPTLTPLKVIIMSATLNVSNFTQHGLFRELKPRVVQAEGRQYNVITHFARSTRRDYQEEIVRKVAKGHRKLPPGGMLVFLTGQNEIKAVLKQLLNSLNVKQHGFTPDTRVHVSATETPLETEDLEIEDWRDVDREEDDSEVDIVTNADEEDEDFENIQPLDTDLERPPKGTLAPHILALYSQLPTKEQMRVFQPPPDGSRLIVLATNVAETSLTIPGIRYVFDCGRSKERVFRPDTGVQSFEIDWISKASSEQRKGRAGRTGPGHCYRLYSSAVYERDFPDHSDPEILRTPVESVVLQVKSFRFPGNVANFPFPTPPSRRALINAEKLLANLGALSIAGQITPLGRDLSMYPLSPRLGKMVVQGLKQDALGLVLALVSALAVSEIFVPESQIDMHVVGHQEDQSYTHKDHVEDDAREKRKQAYGRARAVLTKLDKHSDAFKALTAVVIHAQTAEKEHFCDEHFLRFKAMTEVEQLRSQLTQLVRLNHPEVIDAVRQPLKMASSKDLESLKEIMASGFIDQVALRADLAPQPPDIPRKPKRAIDVPYLPLIPLQSGGSAATLDERAIYIHPTSVLARLSPNLLPQYVVYSHLQQSQSSVVGSEKIAKTRMFPLTSVDGAQLARLTHHTPLLRYGKPVGHVKVLDGFPKRQECWVVPELIVGDGSLGWPLPARKVVQVQDRKKGWVVEEFIT